MELLERIFLSFFHASLTVSVIILIVISIVKIFNNRLSIKVKNALWILVLIKLFMPVIPETNTNLFNILYEKYESMVQSQNRLDDFAQTSKQSAISEDNFEDSKINAYDNRQEVMLSILKIASCIWVAGLIFSSFALLIFEIKLRRKTKNLREYNDAGILTLINECRHSLNIKSRIQLYIYDGFKSPCIIGIIKPKIYIPRYILNIKDHKKLSHVFLHELMHYKRKDLIYNYISIIALLIHWFNPLVWIAIKQMKLYREYACDACVLELLKEDENTDYGMTLLTLSRILLNKGSYSQVPVFFETNNQIKGRICMIKEFKKGSYTMTARAVLGCTIAAIAVFTNNLAVKALDADNIIPTTISIESIKNDYKDDANSMQEINSEENNNVKEAEKDLLDNKTEVDTKSADGKWVQDNGKWYYYNSDGVMLKNTIISGYQLGEDGAVVDNKAADKTNYTPSKKAVTDSDSANKPAGDTVTNTDTQQNQPIDKAKTSNAAKVEDKHVSTDAEKQSDKSWKIEGDSWTYTKKDGKKATGWVYNNKEWYHFDKNGVMDKNTTITEDDGKYELRADGTLKR